MNNLDSKKPEITISNILKKFGYPIFLLAGCLTSVHYAINPVGSILINKNRCSKNDSIK
jgi:hypothetical protein